MEGQPSLRFLLHKNKGQVNSRNGKKKARPPPHRHHTSHRRPHPRRVGREAQRLDRCPARAEAVSVGGDQAVTGEGARPLSQGFILPLYECRLAAGLAACTHFL